ncbi:MAG: hypothetical protein HY902_12185, partial [Deltaproteobacteria bacterium]|nr:hypothetical protein [Deltaproteobacteria bacterium]
AKEDGDLCNGTLYCDQGSHVCAVNPASVVTCTTAFDEPCLTNQCDKKTGACGMKPAHQGNQCDDGSSCSGGGWCSYGDCQVTVKQACECVQDSDCKALEDGDLCNGTLYCDKSGSGKPACKLNPATVVTCPSVDDTACSKNQCQPKTGLCAPTAVPGLCDDGKACTAQDTCDQGSCAGVTKDCADGNACTIDLCKEPQGCVHPLQPASTCDDNNPCTTDGCDAQAGCVHSYTTAVCDDGDLCTESDQCKGGKCQGSAIDCSDGNPCSDDGCDGKVGCTHPPNTGTCDDGNACTGGDQCQDGGCQGIAQDCGDNNPCTTDSCNPKTGCGNLANRAKCDDGTACTSGDVCSGGACGGQQVYCDDGNLCTDDACDAKLGCVHTANTAACSDGNACTSKDTCSNNKCIGTESTCNDANPCTDDGCDPKTGCTATANSAKCDDGTACTSGDVCSGGGCGGQKLGCDDGNPCTDDACDAKLGCAHTANTAGCSDGNACTSKDACSNNKCVGVAVVCDDGNPCSDDACDPKAGCTATANTAKCDDGNACTVSDSCGGGTCQGLLSACNDNNPCTDDSCPSGTCAHAANTAPCSDGNACTSSDVCKAGACGGGSALDCDDNNVCTDDACDAGSGCVHVANAATCTDGNACTSSDACGGGLCGGAKVTCDDGNPCTDDSCNGKNGCVATANQAGCSDGNPCTVGDACASGSCAPGKPKSCDDSNVCTQDSCLSATGQCQNIDITATCDDKNACTDDLCHAVLGCGHANNTAACSDGNPCTTGDGCLGGKCASTGALPCSDSNPCTDDSCDSKQGCVFTANTAACDDGVDCTQSDTCTDGSCAGTLSCDDGKPCTDDACDYGSGTCKHTATVGTCDDSNPCTVGEACTGGVCGGGSLKDCSDGNLCTDDACDSKSGCYNYNNTAPCSTGGCKVDDTCDKGSCKAGVTDRMGSWYSNKAIGSYVAFEARSVLPVGNDWLLAGTTSTVLMTTPATPAAGWLARVSPKGQIVWQQAGNASAATLYAVAFTRILPTQDGNYMAFGQTGGGWGWATKIDANGKYLSGNQFSHGNQIYSHGDTLWRETTSEFVSFCAGANGAGLVWHDPDTGIKIGSVLYDAKGGQAQFWGGTLAADGKSVVAVGFSSEPGGAGGRDACAVFYGPDQSKPPQKKVLVGGTGDDEFRAIARLPDGGFLAAGSKFVSASSSTDILYVRMRSDGSIVYHKTYNTSANESAYGVSVQADGSAVLLGSIGSGFYAGVDYLVMRIDAAGNTSSPFSEGTAANTEVLYQAITLPNGDLLSVGRSTTAGLQSALMLRTTAYLHTTCSAAGLCASKPMSTCATDPSGCKTANCYNSGSGCSSAFVSGATCSDGDACTSGDLCDGVSSTCKGAAAVICDDKNPCTFETCSKTQGCVYTPASDGVSCGSGLTCQAGVCK